MAGQKSYLDFPPLGEAEGRFDRAGELVDYTKTESRRPHVRAYLLYMLPGTETGLDRRWGKACERMCEKFHQQGVQEVTAVYFDFVVDRAVWKGVFSDVTGKASVEVPEWPWGDVQTNEMRLSHLPKSPWYIRYLEQKKAGPGKKRSARGKKSAEATGKNSVVEGSDKTEGIAAQRPLPSLDPTAPVFKPTLSADSLPASDSAKKDVRQTKGLPSSMWAEPKKEVNVETFRTNVLLSDDGLEQRQAVWDLSWPRSAISGPVVGPFQMRLDNFIPLEEYVTGKLDRDWRAVQQAIPSGLKLTLDRSKRELTLDFANIHMVNRFAERTSLCNIWTAMRDWLMKVYDCNPWKLRDELELFSTKNSSPVGSGTDPLWRSYSEAYDGGLHLARNLRSTMKRADEMASEVAPLIKGHWREVGQTILEWICQGDLDKDGVLRARVAKKTWLRLAEPADRDYIENECKLIDQEVKAVSNPMDTSS